MSKNEELRGENLFLGDFCDWINSLINYQPNISYVVLHLFTTLLNLYPFLLNKHRDDNFSSEAQTLQEKLESKRNNNNKKNKTCFLLWGDRRRRCPVG